MRDVHISTMYEESRAFNTTQDRKTARPKAKFQRKTTVLNRAEKLQNIVLPKGGAQPCTRSSQEICAARCRASRTASWAVEKESKRQAL